MNVRDRQRGCLWGLAIGDALGASVEFQMPGTFEEVRGYRDGGPHDLQAGEWTDDTSMALALADSIAEVGWDLDDQATRYLDWYQNAKYSSNGRVFDIGITTSSALMRFRETGDAQVSGAREDRASGNGSIMRLAPVPVAYYRCFPAQLPLLLERAAESSLPTHASEKCLDACRYLALVLVGLLHGNDRDEVLSPHWEPLDQMRRQQTLQAEIDEVAQGSFRDKQPPEITGSGYVVRSLEAALWAFHRAESFDEAVLKAVNLGDDADTTGAICGQLAGAYWGESGIPGNWLEDLAERQMIERIMCELID